MPQYIEQGIVWDIRWIIFAKVGEMIIPVRCFSCGKVIAHKWE